MEDWKKYKRFTHDGLPIDYTPMNLVDDFTDGSGKESALWLVVRWLQAEAGRTVGVGAGVARMLAARLKHELELQHVVPAEASEQRSEAER